MAAMLAEVLGCCASCVWPEGAGGVTASVSVSIASVTSTVPLVAEFVNSSYIELLNFSTVEG